MRNIMLFALAALVWLAAPAAVQAAQQTDHLVINEVYINLEDTRGSWMEVHNPTSDTLFLLGIYAQYIKSPNFLGRLAVEEGGVPVPPKGYVVLCHFQSKEEQIATLRARWVMPEAVPVLPNFDMAWGHDSYLKIWGCTEPRPGDRTYGGADAAADFIWVGGQAETPNEVLCDGYLPYKSGVCAFSRKYDGLDTDDCEADFGSIAATPGRSNAVASPADSATWGEIKKK